MAPQTPQRSGCPGEAGALVDIPGFVGVTRASELAPGAMKWVAIDRERVLIANVGGAFYAIQDVCGHRHETLSKGTLWGYVIECPLHFACFDVRTGKLISGPASADVPTYEVCVEGDTVYVKR
jgi:3-phenylpropionate/trans-cinnamate dioxygenase ferredoxin subunit